MHCLALALTGRGHDVQVIQERGPGKLGHVEYTNYDCAQHVTYDAVIGYCVPDTARWVPANVRLVSIQNDNHWLPVQPSEFDGIDKVVLVGQCLYTHYSQFMSPDRLTVIGNGYDATLAVPDEAKRDKLSLCFSAAPTHSAGLHIALEALKLLGREDIEFHVYGTLELWGGQSLGGNVFTPEDGYDELLRKLVDDCPCPVRLYGALPYKRMLPEYTRHSIMIHPKTHETFGCSIVEAQASGVVPVVAGVYGCADRVHDGVTGYRCVYNDPHSFAARIELLLTDDAHRLKLSENCQQYAQQYTFERIAKEWETLIERSS